MIERTMNQDPRQILAESPMTLAQLRVIAITIGLCALDGFDVLAISFASPGIAREWGILNAAREPKFAWTGPVVNETYWKLAILAVLVGQLRHLPFCCPFRVSWWAVSFPLAASAIAAVRFAAAQPGTVTNVIAWLLIALATLVIAGLTVRTAVGLARGELRRLSA